MHRRVVTLLAAVTLAAGCTSPVEEPPPLPRIPSASASPTEEPNAAPAAVPSAAQAETPQGAAAFARFWFDTLNEAARSGDTKALRALSAPGCGSCTAFAESIEGLYRPGGRIEGGVFSVRAAEAPAVRPEDDSARVTVLYDVSPSEQLGRDGERLASSPALAQVDGDMRLVRWGSVWRVAELMSR